MGPGSSAGPRDPPPTDISRRPGARRRFVVAPVTGRRSVAAMLFFIGPPRAPELFLARPCGARQSLTSSDLTRRSVPAAGAPGGPRLSQSVVRGVLRHICISPAPAVNHITAAVVASSALQRHFCRAANAKQKALITGRDWLSVPSSSITIGCGPATDRRARADIYRPNVLFM